MADENNVELQLTADTTKAKKSLDDFESSASKSISNVTDSFKVLAGVAAAALAFVGAKEVVSFFKESADASAKNEAEVAKLTASLQSLGDFTPEVVKDFREFADQLQSNSKFSDEAAIAQLAFAKQLGLSNEGAEKLIQTAADLASVMGDSLEGAVDELGRTLSGTLSRSLSKRFPELQQFGSEALKSGAAIDFFNDRLKGAAKTAIQTYAGALIQMGNAQEDFQKSVGSIITQNPVVIASIKAVSAGYAKLEELVKENKDQLTLYAATVLKLAVNAIPPLVDALGSVASITKDIIKGLTALISVTADTISGFLQFDTIQTVVNAVVSSIQDTIASLVEGLSLLVHGLAAIPGAGKVFDELGVSISDVGDTLDETAKNFRDLADNPIDFKDTIDGLNKIRDDAIDFGDTTDTVFNGAQDGIKAIGKIARETAKQISDADGDIAKAAKAAGIEETVAGQAAVKAAVAASKAKAAALEEEKRQAEVRKALQTEANAFIDRIFNREAVSIKSIEQQRDRDLALNETYFADLLIPAIKYTDAKIDIEKDAEQKIADLRRKNLEEFKKDISEIASNPIKVFVSDVEVDTDALKGIGEGIAGALGGVSKILEGKKGASDLVAGIGGAFADAFLPGIGGVVTQILSVFAQGPDAVKAMVSEFVQALPEVITNIADAAPAFVDAFIDTMVNKGGAVKIGYAIGLASLKVFTGYAFAELIAHQIFGRFAENIPTLFKNIGNGLSNVFTKIGTSLYSGLTNVFSQIGFQLGSAIKGTFTAIYSAFISVFSGIGTYLSNAFTSVFGSIGTYLSNAFTTVFGSIGTYLSNAFTSVFGSIGTYLSNVFSSAFTAIGTAISKVFTGIGTALSKAFSDAFGGIGTALVTALKNAFSEAGKIISDFFLKPVDKLIDFLGKFKFPDVSVGGITGGSDTTTGKVVRGTEAILTGGISEIPAVRKIFHLAGGGIIPDGYPNDGFSARLQSKEMVLPPDISLGLQDLIRNGGRSNSSDDATVAMLSMLGKIASLLAQPQHVNATAELDGRAFANIILQLNRQNARLQA